MLDSQEDLDKQTTIELISSHGRTDELLQYAETIQDYDLIITHKMRMEEYDKVLELLDRVSRHALRVVVVLNATIWAVFAY